MAFEVSTGTLKSRFPWRVIWVEILLVIAALGAGGMVARGFLRHHFALQIHEQAQDTLKALSVDLPKEVPPSWCQAHSRGTDLRLTVIAWDGKVLCDSEHDPSAMENHANRPEVRDALAQGFGKSERHSATLNRDMLYSAIRTGHQNPQENPSGGVVLREAMTLQTLQKSLRVYDLSLAILLVSFATFFALVIYWGGKTSSVNSGEWSDLENALDQIQSDLILKTEQLSREREELATLMSAISDAIFAADLEGNPLFFNSRFALLFGGKEFQARKPRLGEIFRIPEILRAYQEAFTEGRTQNVDVSLHMSGDSMTHDFTLAVAPLHRDDATVYGAVGIFHDVTELKRAEKIRIDFVANVSHELRTPLTSIKGYADTLKEDMALKRYDSSEKFLEIILKNVDRLMSLIRDLLDLSWLESSQGEEGFSKSSVGTRELTERALLQLEARRAQKNHSIETSYGADIVDVDSARAEQVVVNLVENAIKYTPAGGKISVRWDKLPNAVRLQVSDNGPGIAPEHYPRLFERFYRVDQARSRDVGGTGLGLAIVKHIMQRHGGAISVSGEPSGGTTFTCIFPVT
jgi:two-component system phosphate regulon sensor histidine kinase PhoR